MKQALTLRYCPSLWNPLGAELRKRAVIFGYGAQRKCSKCEVFWVTLEVPFPSELRLLGSKRELRVTH